MKILDIFEATGSNSDVILNYSWTRSGDVLALGIAEFTDSIKIELEVNEKTKAGNVAYTILGIKMYVMEWNAKGNGSWTYFGDEGEVLSEGEWTIQRP